MLVSTASKWADHVALRCSETKFAVLGRIAEGLRDETTAEGGPNPTWLRAPINRVRSLSELPWQSRRAAMICQASSWERIDVRQPFFRAMISIRRERVAMARVLQCSNKLSRYRGDSIGF